MMQLVCVHCAAAITVKWAVPHVCPLCEKPGRWRTMAVGDPPAVSPAEDRAWTLSEADRRFLQQQRITPD